MTRFLDAGRKSLRFSVSIEINLVLVWVVDVDLISAWEIELDLISVQGSELICSVSGDRKRLCSSIWIGIDLNFV